MALARTRFSTCLQSSCHKFQTTKEFNDREDFSHCHQLSPRTSNPDWFSLAPPPLLWNRDHDSANTEGTVECGSLSCSCVGSAASWEQLVCQCADVTHLGSQKGQQFRTGSEERCIQMKLWGELPNAERNLARAPLLITSGQGLRFTSDPRGTDSALRGKSTAYCSIWAFLCSLLARLNLGDLNPRWHEAFEEAVQLSGGQFPPTALIRL